MGYGLRRDLDGLLVLALLDEGGIFFMLDLLCRFAPCGLCGLHARIRLSTVLRGRGFCANLRLDLPRQFSRFFWWLLDDVRVCRVVTRAVRLLVGYYPLALRVVALVYLFVLSRQFGCRRFPLRHLAGCQVVRSLKRRKVLKFIWMLLDVACPPFRGIASCRFRCPLSCFDPLLSGREPLFFRCAHRGGIQLRVVADGRRRNLAFDESPDRMDASGDFQCFLPPLRLRRSLGQQILLALCRWAEFYRRHGRTCARLHGCGSGAGEVAVSARLQFSWLGQGVGRGYAYRWYRIRRG